MAAPQTLLIEDREHIRIVTLARPAQRNALTQQMVAELTGVFLATSTDDAVTVLIIAGAGEAFCSGLDLSELHKISSQSESQQRADSGNLAHMFRALHTCSKPTIAAVQGAAVAGGMGLATICDFTLAAPDARFGYPEVKIGFIPALVSAFLTRQTGEKNARDLLLSGRLIDAHEARGMGLVTRVVHDQPVLEAAQELAKTLLKNSPASLLATKALLLAQGSAQLDRDLAAAAEANAAIRMTADFAEGLAAFFEKRRPRWSGFKN